MSTPEQRRRLRAHYTEHRRWFEAWVAAGYPYATGPALPADLAGLECGAKTRKGTPCQRKDIYLSGRCPLHGGLSTGPKTPEGRAKCAANGLKPKRKKQTP